MARSRGNRGYNWKLAKYAENRKRGKNGRFAMELESDRKPKSSCIEGIIGVLILLIFVAALAFGIGGR